MEPSMDFLKFLHTDISLIILKRLDAPADLVRATAVSRYWQDFVVKHELGKRLCLKKYPQLSCVDEVKLVSDELHVQSGISEETDNKKLDHVVYTSLAHHLDSATKWSCISEALCASSTDYDPDESIENTLIESDGVEQGPSYWSSTGQINADVPEGLTYLLRSSLCLINEIYVQPYQDYFQPGYLIYSSKLVRFRMGSLKFPLGLQDVQLDQLADDDFVWNYTSPEFPMLQENHLQKFQLPKPALCIGGVLKIELLGRVQKHEVDDKYYICVSHVRADGMSLSPKFTVKTLGNLRKFYLEYDPHAVIVPPEETCPRTSEFIDDLEEVGMGPVYWGQFVVAEDDASEDEHAIEVIDTDGIDEDGDVDEHDIEVIDIDDTDEDGDEDVEVI